jgi:hypothetical protein
MKICKYNSYMDRGRYFVCPMFGQNDTDDFLKNPLIVCTRLAVQVNEYYEFLGTAAVQIKSLLFCCSKIINTSTFLLYDF